MSSVNNIRTQGQSQDTRPDRGGSVLYQYPILAVVKDNIDNERMGRIRVYNSSVCGADPNNSSSWISVRYMSPWMGVVSPQYNNQAGNPGPQDYGDYVGNPHSYGFWSSAPDIGSYVICVFVEGRPDQGYYIGGVQPTAGLNHMLPAIGSSDSVVPTAAESQSYGGATRLPVTEVNINSRSIANSPTINDEPRPIHSYQASILFAQGLIRDPERGTISSSAARETPSRVFGWSTPGGAIYNGGYTDYNIAQAAAQSGNIDPRSLQVVGRRGGHTFVMDDGTVTGENQLVRLRTSAGHQILFNDTAQCIQIMHSNGRSWIELGREGTIDLYSDNSVNIRTQGDLNLHADRDININAGRNLNLFGEKSVKAETDNDLTVRSMKDMKLETEAGFSVKSTSTLTLNTQGAASIQGGAYAIVKGGRLFLNTLPGLPASSVEKIVKVEHIDSAFNQQKGWYAEGPTPRPSVVSRLPTHWPFKFAGGGVNVVTDNVARPAQGASASVIGAIQAAGIPSNPITNAVAATAPVLPAVTQGTQTLIPGSLAGVMAAQNSALGLGDIPQTQLGLSLAQAANAGTASLVKPGADEFIRARQAQGLPWGIASQGDLYTGQSGVQSGQDLVLNYPAQAGAFSGSLQQSATQLASLGVIQGTESPAQVAGVVNAGATQGVAAVQGVLGNTATVPTAVGTAGTGLVASISSGTWSSQIGEGVSSAWNSVSTGVSATWSRISGSFGDTSTNLTGSLNLDSLRGAFSAEGGLLSGSNPLFSGAGGGILTGSIGSIAGSVGGLLTSVGGLGKLFGGGGGNTVEGLKQQLAGPATQRYTQAVAATPDLQPGEPNALGGETVVASADRAQDTIAMVDQANRQLAAAELQVRQAQAAVRANPTPENIQAVELAQQALDQAQAYQYSVTTAVMTGVTPAQSETIEIASQSGRPGFDIRNIIKRVIYNFGGVEGIFAQTKFGQNIIPKIAQTATNITNKINTATRVVNVLSNPQLMVGNVMNRVSFGLGTMASQYVQNTVNRIGGRNNAIVQQALSVFGVNASAGAFTNAIRGVLGQVVNGGGTPRTPQYATGTTNSAPILSRLGILVGPKVPPPVFEQNPNRIPTQQFLAAQVKLQNEIQVLEKNLDDVDNRIGALWEQYPGSTNQGQLLTEIELYDIQRRKFEQELVVRQAELSSLQSTK